MMSTRSAHYWLWFLLFGLGSAIVGFAQSRTLSSESLWLLVTGAIGIILARFAGAARPYDLIVGALFTSIGITGIMHNLGFNMVSPTGPVTSGSSPSDYLIGLSLSLPYALIHSVLGLTSLNHALMRKQTHATATVSG